MWATTLAVVAGLACWLAALAFAGGDEYHYGLENAAVLSTDYITVYKALAQPTASYQALFRNMLLSGSPATGASMALEWPFDYTTDAVRRGVLVGMRGRERAPCLSREERSRKNTF